MIHSDSKDNLRQTVTNLDGKVDIGFSETLQNFTTISFDIVDLTQNVTSLEEDVGVEIMNLN